MNKLNIGDRACLKPNHGLTVSDFNSESTLDVVGRSPNYQQVLVKDTDGRRGWVNEDFLVKDLEARADVSIVMEEKSENE